MQLSRPACRETEPEETRQGAALLLKWIGREQWVPPCTAGLTWEPWAIGIDMDNPDLLS